MLAGNLGTTIVNSLTVVPVSHFECCETLFALLRCDDNKLIVEISFSRVISAFRDLSVQRELCSPHAGSPTSRSFLPD